MERSPVSKSAADIEGPWSDPPDGFTSGLIDRCRRFWETPANQLPNLMVATYLNQKIATQLMVEEASLRLASGFVDDTELYDGQLEESLKRAGG
jgi:hypothetical protein